MLVTVLAVGLAVGAWIVAKRAVTLYAPAHLRPALLLLVVVVLLLAVARAILVTGPIWRGE